MRSYDVEMVPTDNGPWCLKSEADREIRHNKYKRCIAMAKLCEAKNISLDSIVKNNVWEYSSNYWLRWRNRWLALAEKFSNKEA